MTRTGDDATAQKGVLKQEGPRSPGPAPAPRASSTLPPRALLQRLVPQHRRGAGALHEQEGQPFRKLVTQLKRGLRAASWQSLGTSFLIRVALARPSCLQSGVRILLSVSFECLLGPPGSLPTVTRLVSRQRARTPIHAELWPEAARHCLPLPCTRLPPGCRTFLPLCQVPHPPGTLDPAESVIRGEGALDLAKEGGPRHDDSPQSCFSSNMSVMAESHGSLGAPHRLTR